MAAIREGAVMGAGRGRTATPGAVPIVTIEAEDEASAPTSYDPISRIEWRQQQQAADMMVVGRVLGELQAGHARLEDRTERTATAVETLAKLAQRADEREERRDERSAAAADKREEREHTSVVAKRTMTEKIALAFMALVGTIGTAYIAYSIGQNDTTAGTGGGRHRGTAITGSATP